jgi:hypothetical protein
MRVGSKVMLAEPMLLNGGASRIPLGTAGRISRDAIRSLKPSEGMLVGVDFGNGLEVWCPVSILREAS